MNSLVESVGFSRLMIFMAHIPVLVDEVLQYLKPEIGSRFIDATLGCGGHSFAILEKNKSSQLLGIDRDRSALAIAKERLAPFGSRASLFHGPFSKITVFADSLSWNLIDGILLDLGISSEQLNRPERGFSFQVDGPLDMRLNQEDKRTAATIVNEASQRELEYLFRRYGEEPKSRFIAKEIVHYRDQEPIVGTSQLSAIIRSAARLPKTGYHSTIARCFQALRIEVNDELQQIEHVLTDAINLLKKGGRLVVISFHSLEDRIVKSKFRYEALSCVCPPKLPVCRCSKESRLAVLTKKPVRASDEECMANSRARPAKLRAAVKL